MTGTTHIAAGFSVGIGISILTASLLPTAAVSTFAAVAGSLLPDIDTASSKLGRKIAPVSWLIRIFIGHRQMFHSLTFWAIPMIVLWLTKVLPPLTIFSASVGILSHLFLDAFNPAGIPIFWPLSKRLSIAKFQCRGIVDYLLTVAFTILTFFLAWHYCTQIASL